MISILALCGGLATILMVTSSVSEQQWGLAADRQMTIAVITSLCGAPLSLVGVGLGIGGFFEVERRRLFVILDTPVNRVALLTYLCGLVALVVLGSG